jgi:hypothetical protein
MLLLSAIFQQYNGLPELFEDWKTAINNKLTGNVLDILKQQTNRQCPRHLETTN